MFDIDHTSGMVRIDVGGEVFTTTYKVLRSHGGMLAMLERYAGDEDIFIDRDGVNFAHVMAFLEHDTPVPCTPSILREMSYYCLTEYELVPRVVTMVPNSEETRKSMFVLVLCGSAPCVVPDPSLVVSNVCSVQGKIFLFGGYDREGTTLDTVWSTEGSVCKLDPLPYPVLFWLAHVVLGYDVFIITNTYMIRYNIETGPGKVSMLPDNSTVVPLRRVPGGFRVIFGENVYDFCIEQDEWTYVKPRVWSVVSACFDSPYAINEFGGIIKDDSPLESQPPATRGVVRGDNVLLMMVDDRLHIVYSAIEYVMNTDGSWAMETHSYPPGFRYVSHVHTMVFNPRV